MQWIKGPLRIFALISIHFSANAAEVIAVSPLAPISAPEFTAFGADQLGFPSVAVSGTNAILVWNRLSGRLPGQNVTNTGITNLFLTRLDSNGKPIDAPPRFVASLYHSYGQPRLVPSDLGFFMLYLARTNATGPTAHLVTCITPEGRHLFPPIFLESNLFKNSAVSNGRTLLVAGGLTQEFGLKYRLITQRGEITNGLIAGAAQDTVAAATDGTDYLVVWRTQLTSELRVTRIFADGQQGPAATITDAFSFTPQIAYGKKGYLLASGHRLILLRKDGTEIGRSQGLHAVAPNAAIYPEGDDWISFYSPSGTSAMPLFSQRINGATLTLGGSAYPRVSSAVSGAGLNTYNMVAPFGPGRYLTASYFGAGILTTSVVTSPTPPITYSRQERSQVASSPFGYVAAWHEFDARSAFISIMRMAKDGTHLDPQPIRWELSSWGSSISCAFDGQDWIIGCVEKEMSPPLWRIAKISPLGGPDLRERQFSRDASESEFSLVANRGRVYAWQSFPIDVGGAELHIFPLLPTGALGPEIIVNGRSLGSDGERLFAAIPRDGSVYVAAIDPDATTPEGARARLASGYQPYVVSGPRGLVVSWDVVGGARFAYLSNGVPRLAGDVPVRREFALSSDRLLVAGESNGPRGRYVFTMTDLATRASTSTNADFGTIHSLNLASVGGDFIGVADALGLQMNYIGKFWVTTASPPTFAAPRVSYFGMTATIALLSQRRYRIESSDDLIEWHVIDVISGQSAYEIATGDAGHQFIRAVLVPE